MAKVGAKDTQPEMIVRRLLHRLGYRYRLHLKTVPGRPDIAFPARNKVILIHGCFWHQHDCKAGRLPKSNVAFWRAKLRRNVERDQEVLKSFDALGWGVLTLWECEMKGVDLTDRLIAFLGPPRLA